VTGVQTCALPIYKLKILLLIPKMDTTIGSTGIADTILVENGAIEFGLSEF
jgi:hypothetical protein